ncbi:MAG TPA: hypothetical protein VNL14_03165 [Candidatus Acidoferrales bacterium]|nr:hypothetical protein [Candidatus Acidoferrales bacterium]
MEPSVLKPPCQGPSPGEFARALRVVGQALEELEVENFCLEWNEREFAVRGEMRALPSGSALPGFKAVWRNFQDRYLGIGGSRQGSAAAVNSIHVTYTLEDIERLDEEHRRRGVAQEKKPDLYSLPEMLRLVGNYIERKGRLVRVARFGTQLTIHFVTASGETKIEECDVAWLYDFSIRMYLKRHDR